MFLFGVQGVGAAFVGVFLTAYLLGLPTEKVWHSDPVFRSTLSVLGVVFIVLVIGALVAAHAMKREN
jgi:hypothetical protein